ncbi:MAG: polysaccharide biosynthesis tyrosine autokinase [Gaiellaceae bacterium]
MFVTDIGDVETERTGAGLSHYAEVIGRRRWIILPIVAVTIVVAALYSVLQKPVYSAQAKIVIGQGDRLFQAQNGNVIQPFTATLADLIKSDIVARRVISTLGLHSTPSSLLSKVAVSTNPQTAVLQLTVHDNNPQQARRIADQFGASFVSLVQDRFGKRGSSASGTQLQLPITASVFDPAHIVPGAVSPKPAQNVVIAAALGIVLGLLAAFLVEQLDGTLRTQEDIEATLGMPVLGRVPVQRLDLLMDTGDVWDGRVDDVEAYRKLRAILYSLTNQLRLRTLLVTSTSEGHGKEAVTANLARAIASTGTRALLIEGDLRRRFLDVALDRRLPGLTNVLAGDASLEQAVRPIVVPPVEVGAAAMQFDFLPSGPATPNPAELSSGASMAELLRTVADRYDYVLIDAAPLLGFADALQLAHMVDGVVLVVEKDHLRAQEAKEFRSVLERLDAHSIGVVVTDSKTPRRWGSHQEPPTDQVDRASEPVAADGVAPSG